MVRVFIFQVADSFFEKGDFCKYTPYTNYTPHTIALGKDTWN